MGLSLLALACLVGAALAGPLQQSSGSCSTHCPKHQNPKFDFESGKKYVYEYRGENYITVAGQEKQKATIEGLVEIHVLTKCELVLKLKNVRINQKLTHKEVQELTEKLSKPVHFGWNDGKVEHICPDTDETPQSLNIKKGVISTVVNYMTKLDTPEEVVEHDSLGKCNTKYSVKYSQGLEITKIKDLKSCTNRHTSVTSILTNPYDSPDSRINSIPLFPDESLKCTQQIENKVYKMIKCTERSTIKPIKHQKSVIQFEGTISLVLLSVGSIDSIQMSENSIQDTLLYDLEDESFRNEKEREVHALLREMCSKTVGVVDTSVSKDFIRLVSLVKSLSYNSMKKTHEYLKNGRLCKSKKVRDIYVDTLPMVGTDGAVKLMVELLEKKEVTGLKAKVWPASFALITKPVKKTIEAVQPLLKSGHSAPVWLGVSALVYRYCRSHSCESDSTVQEIVSEFNKHLGRRCSSEETDKVIATLKAFGNMGQHGEALDNILSCATDKSKPNRVRLAAIDAFRRCHKKRPAILHLYTNTDEDYEIRIAAFASSIKTADSHLMKEIKKTAERETNEQVNGYVSTYLKNMKKTSSPLKRHQKKMVNEVNIHTPNVNYWKNSKNVEVSAFSQALNVGGGIEADIIHSEKSKIPRSIRSSLDADMFGSNINLVEFGIRAEGIEELIKNIVGMKDGFSKSPSWKIFNSQNVMGDSEADVSVYLRTMNTEIFDVAASDLSAIGEIVQIAELMNKLAIGRKADFSHSFLFVDAKLHIPSVTGKSYSIAVQGSITVGLTASGKMDVLTFPKNSDIHLHFQPSANVELSTTVGIKSNTHRPDIKLVSRLHMQSDVESRAHIKDGHIAVASLTLPSENIAMARMSTDVLEIDSEHNEKRVFEHMQSKIDHCFSKLEKPLGVSACAKVQLPKPFVRKSFPYIYPIGSVEFALKKTDNSFQSYELQLEIPKHAGEMMKYKASIDTPGSHVNRRFAAELELKSQKDHKQFQLELSSPFKSAGGSGSLTVRNDLLQGSFELHGSSRFLSANMSTEIQSSRSRKVYTPSIEVSYRNRESLRMGGTVSVIKGRKHHVTFDLKANRPRSSPLELKGSVTKEGKFDLSSSGDWKLSSDLGIQSPMGSAQMRGALEKRSKTSQTLVTSFSVDYQRPGRQQHSMKLSASSQRSSGKMSTNAQFESTQYPSTNCDLSWDMQRESGESIKNDMTFKYGRNPERQYISLKQVHHMPSHGQGRCSISLKAPQFNIDSEVKATHEVQIGEKPRLYLDVDVRYKADMHAKTLLEINYESRHPLKANSRLQIEYPGQKFSYSDEVEEKERDHYQGKANFQWKENKNIELKYRYQKQNDESKLHHEIETSLRLPSFSSPIKSKASLKLNQDSLAVSGHVGSDYYIEAHLNDESSNYLSLKSPKLDGHVKVNNEDRKKSLDIDMKLKTRSPRHITAKSLMQYDEMKHFEVEVVLDADRQPNNKIYLQTTAKVNKPSYISSTRFQYNDLVDFSLSEQGDISFRGNQEVSLEVSIKNKAPISLSYKQQGLEKALLKISKNHVEKALIEMERRERKSNERVDSYIKVSAKSPDNSFESMEYEADYKMTRSGESYSLDTYNTFKKGNKLYKGELAAEVNEKSLDLKLQSRTPYSKFAKQSIHILAQRSSSSVSYSIDFKNVKNQVISIMSEIKKKSHGFGVTLSVKTPWSSLQDAKAHLAVDNHQSKKSLLSYIEANGERVGDVQASMTSSSEQTELQASVELSPKARVSCHRVEFDYKRSSNSVTISSKAKMSNGKDYSASYAIKEERDSIYLEMAITTPKESLQNAKVHMSVNSESLKKSLLVYVDANNERKFDSELSVSRSSSEVEVQGRVKTARNPEVSGHLKVQKSGESYALQAKILKGTTPLLSTDISRRQVNGEEKFSVKTKSFEKSLLDLEASKEVSGDSKKYSLRASGEFAPFSLSLSTSRSEQSSLSLEVRACRGEKQSTCYNLKSYQKSLVNSENYRLYKKLTFDLEKSVGDSQSETVGSAHFLLSANQRDYKSKVMIQYQKKNVGYEIKAHIGHNEQEECSVEGHLFMPQRTSRARAGIRHNRNEVMIQAEAIPDTTNPAEKYSVEMKRESQQNEVSAHVSISRPGRSKPITANARIQTDGKALVEAQAEMQYCDNEKSWKAEVTTERQSGNSDKRTMICKLYNQDKSTDVSLKLIRSNSREEDSYGYEWSFQSRDQSQKKGGFYVKLSQKRNGKPKTIHVKYFTPTVDIKLNGDASRAPSDVNFSIEKNGETLKEIRIEAKDSCLIFESKRTGRHFKSSMCINKRVGHALQLVSIDTYYKEHKCVDVKIGFDPENPAFIDVTMRWEKRELKEALVDLTGFKDMLKNQSFREIVQQFKREIKHIRDDIMEPHFKNLIKKLKQIKHELSEKIREVLKDHFHVVKQHLKNARKIRSSVVDYIKSVVPWDYIRNQVLEPIVQTVKCFMEESIQIILKHIPDFQKVVVDVIKTQFEHCLKKFCTPGTFCNHLVETYKRHGLKEVKKVLKRKITETKRQIKAKIPTHHLRGVSDWIENIIEKITQSISKLHDYIRTVRKSIIASIHDYLGQFFGNQVLSKLAELIKTIETKFRTIAIHYLDKAIEWVNQLFGFAERDEDFRMAKSIIIDAKQKIVQAWKNRDELAQNQIVKIEHHADETLRNFLKDKIQVNEFNIKEGKISMKIRQPLSQVQMEVLKNELRNILRKLSNQ